MQSMIKKILHLYNRAFFVGYVRKFCRHAVYYKNYLIKLRALYEIICHFGKQALIFAVVTSEFIISATARLHKCQR